MLSIFSEIFISYPRSSALFVRSNRNNNEFESRKNIFSSILAERFILCNALKNVILRVDTVLNYHFQRFQANMLHSTLFGCEQESSLINENEDLSKCSFVQTVYFSNLVSAFHCKYDTR